MCHEVLDLAQDDGVFRGVDARHVDGMRACHAKALALTDRVPDGPVVATQHLTARVHDVALRQRRAVASLYVAGEVVARHEADSLAVAFARVLKALLAGDAAHVELLEQTAERQQRCV